MMERRSIEERIRDWIARWAEGEELDPADAEVRFDRLARDVFAFQFDACEEYGRFCRNRGRTPPDVGHWSEIPAVPTGAFKEMALRCFSPDSVVKVFRTSGTTRDARGELHLDSLELYEASLLPTFVRFFLPDLDRFGGRMDLHILTPPPDEAPDSSLSHMFGCLVESVGGSRSEFYLRDGVLQIDRLIDNLESRGAPAASGSPDSPVAPVALCGTAFAFVHLLDAATSRNLRLPLPAGSRIMETGGFKGKSREVSRTQLYEELSTLTGVATERMVNQYGMTELGSQFYDSVLQDCTGPRRKLGPPWARIRILDPRTGAEAAMGEEGIIAVHDLANVGSVAAIETADLGRSVPGASGVAGFEICGRDREAEARGCSRAADAMLAAPR